MDTYGIKSFLAFKVKSMNENLSAFKASVADGNHNFNVDPTL